MLHFRGAAMSQIRAEQACLRLPHTWLIARRNESVGVSFNRKHIKGWLL